MDLSPRDLLEPIQILGKEAEFGELFEMLQKSSRNPATNRRFYRGGYIQQLEALYYKLRISCMVRRGEDFGLPIQRRVEEIELSDIPARINPANVLSDWRRLGLQKTPGAIAWLKEFLRRPGKTLIIAHHNDVVKEISGALNIPAIYGPLSDDAAREKRVRNFLSGQASPALLVADDVDFPWRAEAVSSIVVVELLLTPQRLAHLLEKITGDDTTRSLPVYFLLAPSFIDWDALERLGLRLMDNARVVDGK
jgi:hypothetical protein